MIYPNTFLIIVSSLARVGNNGESINTRFGDNGKGTTETRFGATDESRNLRKKGTKLQPCKTRGGAVSMHNTHTFNFYIFYCNLG